MSTKRRKLWILFVLLFGIALAAFLPLVEPLPHPESVTVQVEGEMDLPLNLWVVWYDLGLNTNYFSQTVEFDAKGRAEVPDVGVRAPLWRIGLKRVLSPFDAWTDCEHCHGPWVDCSLRLKAFDRPTICALLKTEWRQARNSSSRFRLFPMRPSSRLVIFGLRIPAISLQKRRS